MDMSLYISFIIVSFGLIVIPGPNVIVIVSSSIAHGKERGLQTVAGTSLAMAAQLLIAAVCTSSFIQLMAEGFSILKWLGVVYLIYLGITHIKQALVAGGVAKTVSATSTFNRGFVVSITNPKTILFFSAFFPQFISSTENYMQQIGVLSVSFFLMALILDSCYAILASKIVNKLNRPNIYRAQNLFCGLLFLSASAWLAVARRTQ